jgi:hypothetical protein
MKRSRVARWSVLVPICLTVALAAAIVMAFGCNHSPTEPVDSSLTGQWAGSFVRGPCAGDWSSFTISLVQSGSSLTGEIITKDGIRFSLTASVTGGNGTFTVPLPLGQGECETLSFSIDRVERDSAGRAVAFSGEAQGQCCGTIIEPYRFTRLAGT